jgi:type VI secretion system protein ImpG
MEELLPYYERELAFLRRHSRDFAERYPKIAARLLLNGDGCDDPHVERMIESFALLSARVTKRLEDAYPQFTEALLGVLYPHYLRPFPSCSIARVEVDEGSLQWSSPVTMARGTELQSRPVRGAACRFRTAWSVDMLPVRVAAAGFEPVAHAPHGVRLPIGCTALLSLKLECSPAEGGWGACPAKRLRFFIDAEPSIAAALRDALFLRVVKAYASGDEAHWFAADAALIDAVGFGKDEALLEFPPNSHDAYRHLTEYFAFPDKYNFFDLRVDRLPPGALRGATLTVLLALDQLRADSDASRLLHSVTADSLRLGCVPVVNLFAQLGDPIRITGRNASYPVVADGRRAHAYEVHSIDAVRRVRHTAQGESITELRPFFGLHHGESPERQGHYWFAQRNALVADRSPGYETELTVVDADFDPVQPKSDVLSVALTCSNRELPTFLAIGMPGGDLFAEGGPSACCVRLLRKPTPPYRFDHRHGGQWRLVSHLALNHLSLTASGLHAFREMLGLYDLPRTAVSRRLIDGIEAIAQQPHTTWMAGNPFASFVRGLEVRITVDEESFVGTGLDIFARVIDHFLGLYVHLNSFVQLVVISKRSSEELIRCAPRTGESILG